MNIKELSSMEYLATDEGCRRHPWVFKNDLHCPSNCSECIWEKKATFTVACQPLNLEHSKGAGKLCNCQFLSQKTKALGVERFSLGNLSRQTTEALVLRLWKPNDNPAQHSVNLLSLPWWWGFDHWYFPLLQVWSASIILFSPFDPHMPSDVPHSNDS